SRLFLEDVDEQTSNRLPFFFGIGLASEGRIESFLRINSFHIQSKLRICNQYFVEFILAQHSIVDEDPKQLVAYGTMNQCCCNRRIDSAAECHDHLPVADSFLQLFHHIGDEVCRGPVLRASTSIDEKILQYLLSFHRVIDLGMKLQSIKWFVSIFSSHPESGDGNGICCCQHLESCGQFENRIGVTHPHMTLVLHFPKQLIFLLHLQNRPAIFALVALLHSSSKLACGQLSAVANAKHRHIMNEFFNANLRCVRIVNGERRTREYYPF